MRHCCKQARERIYIGSCACRLKSLDSPRASGVCLFSMRYHSPRVVILLVSGLREWDLVRVGLFTRGCSPPNPFGGSDRLRQNLFTPHHILEWGAKTALADAIWLYELPSGSRNHILELREKSCYLRRNSDMRNIALSTTLHRNQAHGSPERRAVTSRD